MNSKTRHSLMIVLLVTFTLSVGSCIKIHVTKDIKADCSSDAQISVTGNPTTRDTNSSSGGSVHFK